MSKVCPYRIAVVIALLLSPCVALAQSSLALSSGSAAAGGSFSLNLSLSSPSASTVASLQWTVTYPSSITNLSIKAGPSGTAAGKSLTCAVTPSGFECIASGPNQNVIANGVVATVSGTVSASAVAFLNVSGAMASAPKGTAISVTATGGWVSPPAPATIGSLACNPASLGPGASAICTVTLSGPAGAGGANVSLGATGSIAIAVNSLAIASGTSTGTFTATAGQFKSDQSATVTASLNGSTGGATIALATLPLVSSLQCAAAGLASNGSTTCTVTLSKAAPAGGTSVAISTSGNYPLTMPASALIPQKATSASFSVSVGSITSDQNITIIASLNGSVAITALSLTAPVVPSSVACAKSFLPPGGSTACTVTLAKAVPAGSTASIAVSSGNPLLKVSQAAVIASSGATSVAFTATAGTFSSNSSGTLSTSLNGISKTVTISLLMPGSLASLACAPLAVVSGGSGSCTVILSSALSSATTVTLTTSNAALSAPGSVTIAKGAASAAFNFAVGSGFVGSLTLTAKSGALSQSAVITVSAAATKHISAGSSPAPTAAVPIGLACDHPFVAAGQRLICEVDFNTPVASDSIQIAIASRGGGVAVPATVGTRAGQSRVRFEVEADPAAPQDTAVLEARLGSVSVQHSIALLSSGAPNLVVPAHASGTPRSPIALTVMAADAHGLDVHLAAAGLPRGATFDPNSGRLKWTPEEKDLGVHEVAFTASNTLGASATKTVKLYVDSGLPVVTKLENGAGSGAAAGCSPGSVATIRGRSLFTEAIAGYDPAGGSDNLSGTRVLVNGVPTAVLFASASRVDLLCPAAAAGTPLAISVETAAGKSNELHTSMRESAPGLFTTNGAGTGQTLATPDGSLLLAAIPNARYSGMPAFPDDMVSFRATGVDCNRQTAPRLSLNLGPYLVPVVDARPLAGHAGICELLARVPAVAGDAVPVTLTLLQNDGKQVASNEGTIGVAARQ